MQTKNEFDAHRLHEPAYLCFEAASDYYALEVQQVQQVLKLPVIVPLRGTAEFVPGIISLDGQFVPVVDLGLRLGLTACRRDVNARLVLLDLEGGLLGLLVDALGDIGTVAPEASGDAVAWHRAPVSGTARCEGRNVRLIDTARLLG